VSQANETGGLYSIYCLIEGVVEEYTLDMQVVNEPTSRGSPSQNSADGSRFYH
jgi:hypothetical protein